MGLALVVVTFVFVGVFGVSVGSGFLFFVRCGFLRYGFSSRFCFLICLFCRYMICGFGLMLVCCCVNFCAVGRFGVVWFWVLCLFDFGWLVLLAGFVFGSGFRGSGGFVGLFVWLVFGCLFCLLGYSLCLFELCSSRCVLYSWLWFLAFGDVVSCCRGWRCLLALVL